MVIYDISMPLWEGMDVFPGDPRPRIRRVQRREDGAKANVSILELGSHTGTHVDPPFHFIDGEKVDELALDRLFGEAFLADLTGKAKKIEAADLEPYGTRAKGKILLIKTRNSAQWGKGFLEDFVYVTKGAAEWMVAQGIKSLGFDALSVERYGAEPEVHLMLLRNGIYIVEGLDLRAMGEGNYHFACLPLKVRGGDGAPARAVLVPHDR